MNTALVLSDIHFGTHGADTSKVISGIEMMAHATEGKTVIIAGDFSQDARTSEIGLAAELVRKLLASRVHVIVTPGNHDYGRWAGEKLVDHRARQSFYQAVFKPIATQKIVRAVQDTDLLLEIGDDLFICLRSTHASWRHAGRIKKKQITWAQQALRAVQQSNHRVHLVTHRSLWGDVEDHHRAMYKTERLTEQLLSPFRVRTIIHGHNHVSKVGLRVVHGWPIVQVSAPTLAPTRSRGNYSGALCWNPSAPTDVEFVEYAEITERG
jgi:3',5'-cyclic AMP phosphodiesterase CpdA